MKTILIFCCFLFTFSAFGMFEYVEHLPRDKSGWSSGGGNAVICFQPRYAKEAKEQIRPDGSFPDILFNDLRYIDSVTMLDLYEASLPRGVNQTPPNIIPIKDDENLKDYISDRANRFWNHVYDVSSTIFSGMWLLRDSNIRFHQGAVTQNKDTGHPTIINRETCVVSTIANQRSRNNYFELYIDSRAFNHPKHSKLSKAILMLHEYIYAYARSKGETDSLTTRRLVEIVISKHSEYTVDYVTQMVEDLNFGVLSIPDRTIPRGYIMRSSLVDRTLFWFQSAFKDEVYKRIKTWKPENFEKFIAEFNKVNLRLNMPQFNFINSLYDMQLVFQITDEIPLDPEYERYFVQYLEYVKERNRIIMAILTTHYDSLVSTLKRLPALQQDRELMLKVSDWTLDAMERMLEDWVATDEGMMLQIIFVAKRSDEQFREIFHNTWIEEFQINLHLVLNNVIE